MGVAFGLSLLAALPEALVALWLKLLATGLLDGNHAAGPTAPRPGWPCRARPPGSSAPSRPGCSAGSATR